MDDKAEKPRSPLRALHDFDRQDTRRAECEHFKSFQYLAPEIRSDNIQHADSPDFRIALDGRVVGVEHTQLFKRHGSQDVESAQDRILDLVCTEAAGLDLPPAHVTLFFNLRKPLKAAHRKKIASAVVAIIKRSMPGDRQSTEIEGQVGQPPEVDLILINRHWDGPSNWCWQEAVRIDSDVRSLVQEAIIKKAGQLSSYLKFCTECWLLIVADSFRKSGGLAFEECSRAHVFDSPFARTYILDYGKGRLHRLRTESPETT